MPFAHVERIDLGLVAWRPGDAPGSRLYVSIDTWNTRAEETSDPARALVFTVESWETFLGDLKCDTSARDAFGPERWSLATIRVEVDFGSPVARELSAADLDRVKRDLAMTNIP